MAGKILGLAFGLATLLFGLSSGASAATLAKNLFGAEKLPAATSPEVYGFYSKGCIAGAVALPLDGPHWQVMRPSRNRRWGHPELIGLIEDLSQKAAANGWPGLLIGDISQPRGGPMISGHASHQLGLDADIWLTPMPAGKRLSDYQREHMAARSVLKKNSLYLDDRIWTPAYTALLKDAASYGSVERIFVHPGIKKELCDTVKGDRSWLSKIRPFWGHDDHIHVRMSCPPGSPDCKPQSEPPSRDGCGKDLAWWFGDEPWRPAKGPKKPPARDIMTMASLPKACQAVLDAPSPQSAAAATYKGSEKPDDISIAVSAYAATPVSDIPIPFPRPAK
jgi:penicillin-insensitive murein endopeptidase